MALPNLAGMLVRGWGVGDEALSAKKPAVLLGSSTAVSTEVSQVRSDSD